VSLRTRLTLAVAAIVAAAVVTGAYASHLSTSSELRAETDKFLLDRSERFTRQPPRQDLGFDLGPPGGGGGGRGRDDQRGPGREPFVDFDAVTQVLSASGVVTESLPDQPALPVEAKDRALASSRSDEHTLRDVTVDGVHYRMLTASLPGGGAVQLARGVGETDEVLAVLRNRLLLIALAGTLLAGLVGWALARRTTKPIEQLTATAEQVATTQDLTTPIPVKGTDEVGRLAGSFNTMLAALATSRDQQKRLVADASHELRTPLTAVRTNIEFLERAGSLDLAERRDVLAATRLELDELTTLMAELVELATDARNNEPVTSVDLADVASVVAARFRRRSGRPVNVVVKDAAVIEGRRAMLERAVSNLIDNALKFSDGGAPVDVTVSGDRIEVADRGSGIAPDDRSHVFDRFYRSAGARSRPGSGLGLSIVSQIAEVHGGSASVHERAGGGTVARLDLGPVAHS
jgi:two-component system sensor histidine kinase MprB